MSSPIPSRALLAVAALTVAAGATPPTRDRVAPEELAARRAAAAGLLARQSAATADKLPEARPEFRSIVENSQLISDGSRWTLVPKGAVLHVPEALAARLAGPATGAFVPWNEFLTLNRAWVEARNVSLEQARGDQPLAANEDATPVNNTRLVVAVHRGGPISVRPPSEQS